MSASSTGDYGQMLLYLRWLDAYQRHLGDSAPVGLILCTACAGPHRREILDSVENIGLEHRHSS